MRERESERESGRDVDRERKGEREMWLCSQQEFLKTIIGSRSPLKFHWEKYLAWMAENTGLCKLGFAFCGFAVQVNF